MVKRTALEQTRPSPSGRTRGLVSSRVSGKRVEAFSYQPAEDLRDVVAVFWTGRWDLRNQAPHVTELLSDPCVNFAFEEKGQQIESRLVGVWTRLWRRTLEETGLVRGVKLRAGAVRAFIRTPAHRFANRIVPLGTAFDDASEELEREALQANDEQAFARVAEWLRTNRIDDPKVGLAVALVDRIASDPEITTVERLAEVGGFSTRDLQRLFREYVGASPKWVIRRNRLQEAALRIELDDLSSLAALAAELGYADQAHLARDFRNAVGKSPSEFAESVHR